jgi:hypothetical protein
MKNLDKSILTIIRHSLRVAFEEVSFETDDRSIDYFVKRKGSQYQDHIAVYLNCDDELTVSADCWNQEDNVPTENAIKFLISA